MSFLYEFTASCMCVECLCLGSLGLYLLLLSVSVFERQRTLHPKPFFNRDFILAAHVYCTSTLARVRALGSAGSPHPR